MTQEKISDEVYSFLLDNEQLKIYINNDDRILNNEQLFSDSIFADKNYVQTYVKTNKSENVIIDNTIRMSKTNRGSYFTIKMNIKENEIIKVESQGCVVFTEPISYEIYKLLYDNKLLFESSKYSYDNTPWINIKYEKNDFFSKYTDTAQHTCFYHTHTALIIAPNTLSEHSGGTLHINNKNNNEQFKIETHDEYFTVVIFPIHFMHEVEKITHGIRHIFKKPLYKINTIEEKNTNKIIKENSTIDQENNILDVYVSSDSEVEDGIDIFIGGSDGDY